MKSRTGLIIGLLALCTLPSAPSATATMAESLLSPSAGEERTVLAEVFGATWCQNCSLASTALDSLSREFGPDSLIVLEYHWADGLAIPEGEDRARWYVPGPFSIPNTWFDGLVNVVGASSGVYDTYRGHVIDRLNVRSPLSIELGVMPYQATATIKALQPLSATDLKAHIVIYENDVDDRFDYVVREILPAENLSLSSKGDSAVVNREFDIDPSCDPDHLGVVVFVQSESTKSILQAAREVLAFCPSDNEDTLQDDDDTGNIDGYQLSQNYPNPFNPTTSIEFVLPKSGEVRVDVFNILGQRVRALVYRDFTTGRHLTTWDGRDDSSEEVASGVYFYRLKSPDFVETRRMLLMR
ncbi:MAG: T9SS type A sorting domain-containing protein [Candidatus Zixiibacteriota bacterium]|nr:MAG: T9SS type A sorting domain-containing protein [candidate division Zixibacteria bacterium]